MSQTATAMNTWTDFCRQYANDSQSVELLNAVTAEFMNAGNTELAHFWRTRMELAHERVVQRSMMLQIR